MRHVGVFYTPTTCQHVRLACTQTNQCVFTVYSKVLNFFKYKFDILLYSMVILCLKSKVGVAKKVNISSSFERQDLIVLLTCCGCYGTL